ncbi:MAG: CoA-binding protein [Candidatus Thorarchaeota archaeon]|nr:CoA-binding protein [Candidatus Thorarchaeota archaeon]
MAWKMDSLRKLFAPESVAVIGASDKPNKLGALTLRALRSFEGDVHPVNPRLSQLDDMKCYSSVINIESNVDLAVIAVGAPTVPTALAECAEAGVGSAIIFSAGFKELGTLGEQLQKHIKKIADSAQIAVIGPNCLGAGNLNVKLNATFFPHDFIPLRGGKVSFVSQSGGVAGLMIYAASDSDLGVAKFASIGNRVNVDFHDMLKFLSQDSDTEVICLFVEGTEHGRMMYEEMSKVATKKPVIVYKVGKTPVSRSAALSHTGSLAGQPELYTAAVKQAGGVEVKNITEMIDTAKVISLYGSRPKGNRVAIVTHTLGPALIATQVLEEQGIQLPPPSEDTIKTVQELLAMPIEIPVSNPVDLLAQGWSQPQIFGKAFRQVMNEEQYDAAMIVFSPNYLDDIGGGMPIDIIIETKKQTQKPVIAILNTPECKPPPGKELLENAGIPVFSGPERAAQALANALLR